MAIAQDLVIKIRFSIWLNIIQHTVTIILLLALGLYLYRQHSILNRLEAVTKLTEEIVEVHNGLGN